MAKDMFGNDTQTQNGSLQLPQIQLPRAPTTPNVSFQGIYDLLAAKQPQMSQSVLPYILQTLQAPVASLRESGAQNVAAAQSDAMKRGLTGSDIESAGMLGARTTMSQQIADAHAQISQQLAQYIMKAYGMDIDANREMMINLAQAIGQKLVNDQEYQMFLKQMEEGGAAEGRNRLGMQQSALWNAIGSTIGTGIGAKYGGPMGAEKGKEVGGSWGSYAGGGYGRSGNVKPQ